MTLFKITIIDQKWTMVTQWKEKANGKSALEWAASQAAEIFGDTTGCRYIIEEEKPTA